MRSSAYLIPMHFCVHPAIVQAIFLTGSLNLQRIAAPIYTAIVLMPIIAMHSSMREGIAIPTYFHDTQYLNLS